MNFIEAYACMQDGKRVRLKNWNPKKYMYIDGGILLHLNDGGADISYSSDIIAKPELILSEEWEIYEEAVEMDNKTAFEELLKGKHVRRKSWINHGFYLKLVNGSDLFHDSWFDEEDFDAEDWIVVE